MKTIYFYLSIILLILLATLGTWSLVKPINLVEDRSGAWIGWGVIIVSTVMKFYGTIYQNYLEGLNKIALVRRIEAIMSLGGIITSIVVLLLGGDVLYLVIAVQLWAVLNVVRNWYLARIIEGGQYKKFKKQPFDKALFKKIWSPAWRSGISGVMSNGLTHLSGVLYAQIGSANIVAGYLLALRIITQIREVSMAPFYSKIPVMARLRVEGKNQGLIKIAQRGMFVSHLVFVLGVVVVAFFSQPLLKEINSNTLFVSNEFWMLLSFAFFVHRYGAMHMQLYLTTNHVMSHIADGVSGIIFMVVGFMSVRWLGLYAIPVGMLAGYLGFYAWFAAIYSYKSLNINFIDYEKHAVFFPLFIYCIHLILSCFFNN